VVEEVEEVGGLIDRVEWCRSAFFSSLLSVLEEFGSFLDTWISVQWMHGRMEEYIFRFSSFFSSSSHDSTLIFLFRSAIKDSTFRY